MANQGITKSDGRVILSQKCYYCALCRAGFLIVFSLLFAIPGWLFIGRIKEVSLKWMTKQTAGGLVAQGTTSVAATLVFIYAEYYVRRYFRHYSLMVESFLSVSEVLLIEAIFVLAAYNQLTGVGVLLLVLLRFEYVAGYCECED